MQDERARLCSPTDCRRERRWAEDRRRPAGGGLQQGASALGGRSVARVKDELPAYASHLTLYFGLEAPALPRPGSVTDATDPRLRRWRELVVDPVVTSMLGPDELESVSVHDGQDGTPGDVWVCLTACGEEFVDVLRPGEWEAADAEVAERLADHLQDWIAESRFGWGQLRVADYRLG